MSAALKAISINFHGLPSFKGDSVSIVQDYAARATLLTIKGQPDGLIVTGVFVDGLPQWTVPGALPGTIYIRPPLMQQGERIEIRCVIPCPAAQSPAKGSKWAHPACPTPDESYGLQRPVSPKAGSPCRTEANQ